MTSTTDCTNGRRRQMFEGLHIRHENQNQNRKYKTNASSENFHSRSVHFNGAQTVRQKNHRGQRRHNIEWKRQYFGTYLMELLLFSFKPTKILVEVILMMRRKTVRRRRDRRQIHTPQRTESDWANELNGAAAARQRSIDGTTIDRYYSKVFRSLCTASFSLCCAFSGSRCAFDVSDRERCTVGLGKGRVMLCRFFLN